MKSIFKNFGFSKKKYYSHYRPYFCTDQIDTYPFYEPRKPNHGSFIDALTVCAERNSKIASIYEIEKYWKYSDEHNIHLENDTDCRNYFWTSNKPINNTHLRIVELDEVPRSMFAFSI